MDLQKLVVYSFGASLPCCAVAIAVVRGVNHFLPLKYHSFCRSLLPAMAAGYASYDVTEGQSLLVSFCVAVVWALLMQVGRVTGKGLEPYEDQKNKPE